MPVRRLQVTLKLPFIEIGGEWSPNEAERRAAWEMYVELVTRISVAELRPDEGGLREALSSLYSLFETTRDILRRYGPEVAKTKRDETLSFGYIAVAILNAVLRPLLARWHPRLQSHEATRPADVSPPDHERTWAQADELREALNGTRTILVDYAELLARVTGAPSLLDAAQGSSTAAAPSK